MIEEYVYSAAEELGGFLIFGFGLVCIVVLFIAAGVWELYQDMKKEDGGESEK